MMNWAPKWKRMRLLRFTFSAWATQTPGHHKQKDLHTCTHKQSPNSVPTIKVIRALHRIHTRGNCLERTGTVKLVFCRKLQQENSCDFSPYCLQLWPFTSYKSRKNCFTSSDPHHGISKHYILTNILSMTIHIRHLRKQTLRSGSAHWALALAVEVQRGAHGWGPAVPTDIWSSRLRSRSAHWALELAVEVWQCPLIWSFEAEAEAEEGRAGVGGPALIKSTPGRWGKKSIDGMY